MISVSVAELEKHKEMPFDLYDKDGGVLLKSGDLITPSKLLQFRYIKLFKKSELLEPSKLLEEKEEISQKQKRTSLPAKRLKEINTNSVISPRKQLEIKSANHEILDMATQGFTPDLTICNLTRDKIVNEVLDCVDKVSSFDHLRIYDDYDYAHGINVSLLSVMLGYRLNCNLSELHKLAIGGFLHDIGKVRIPLNILNKEGALTEKEYQIVKLHAPLGFRIIRDEIGLSEDVAKIALEHQERFSGCGYPRSLSGDSISKLSQIVSICDVYDSLVSTKDYGDKNPSQEALRIMLSYGSQWFNPGYLYTFVQ